MSGTENLLSGNHPHSGNAHTNITLTTPNPFEGGQFGYSVAIDGKYTVVGAPQETAAGLSEAGNAYVFNSKTGVLIETLVDPNAQESGHFGYSVAISGTYVVVGAPNEAVSPDGNVGHAYIFNVTTGALLSTLTTYPAASPDAYFGSSIAISGNIVVIGAYHESITSDQYAGYTYTFSAIGIHLHTFTSPNPTNEGFFGYAVAVSGEVIVIGAIGENSNAGRAYTFNDTTDALISTLTSPNSQSGCACFGISVSVTKGVVAIGAPYETVGSQTSSGRVYTFNSKTGSLIETIESPTPKQASMFGYSLALGKGTVSIGAPDETTSGVIAGGIVYTFNSSAGTLINKLSSPSAQTDGFFGFSIAQSGKAIVVGADSETSGNTAETGNAYIFP